MLTVKNIPYGSVDFCVYFPHPFIYFWSNRHWAVRDRGFRMLGKKIPIY